MFKELWKVENNKLREGTVKPGEAAAQTAARIAAAEGATKAEAVRTRRAYDRTIAFHKYFILLLLVAVGGLGYYVSHVFSEQSGTIERQRMRAYVMPKAETHVAVPAELPFTIKIPMENTGMTPAYGVSARLWVRVAKYPLPSNISMEEGEEHVYLSRPVVIKPGEEAGDIANITLTPADPIAADFASLKNNKRLGLYVAGTVKYHDEFNVDHFSDFCLGYRANLDDLLESFTCRLHNNAN